MHFRRQGAVLLFALSTMFVACPYGKEGSIKGVVSPASQIIRIEVYRQETRVAATSVADDGRFLFKLEPGTYDVRIISWPAPLPVVFPGVVVRSGESTDLGIIDIPPASGNAIIRGQVKNATADTMVRLLLDGRERAAVHTESDGSYEFERLLPAGYTLRVETPAYADESLPASVREGQTLRRDIRQLYITDIEGADWASGTLRARGIGLPPPQAPTPTVRHALSKRAALAHAERNLLRVINLIQIGPEQKLTDLLGKPKGTARLEGYLKGHRIIAERDLDGGRVEIELELPLTGPDGLGSYLSVR